MQLMEREAPGSVGYGSLLPQCLLGFIFKALFVNERTYTIL